MADVERSRRREGRRVDDEVLLAGARRVEAVRALVLPEGVPARLGGPCIEVLGNGVGIDADELLVILTHGRVRIRQARLENRSR